jgi:hypothetical protein
MGRGRDVQNIASAAHASLLFENTEVLTERYTIIWWEEVYREYGGVAEETG